MAYTLTAKSQVTLPKAIRDHLKLAPGDAVTFRITADGGVRVDPVAPAAATQGDALAAARQRFTALRGRGGHASAGGTDALMRLLRGYDEDAQDPGFKTPDASNPP